MKLDGSASLGIIDTGAEVNLLNQHMVAEVKESPVRRIADVGGRDLEVLGQASSIIETADGIKRRIEGLVLRDTPLILGLPFLNAANAVIHCRSGFMELDGRHLYQLIRTRMPAVRCVRPIEETAHQLLLEATSDTNFSPEVLEGVRAILWKYRDMWEDDNKIGRTSVVEHEIDLTTSKPIACRPRRYTEEQKLVIEKEIDAMLQSQVIRPSQSPYASGIVLVKKKTGDWRFCLDFRPLNEKTVKDQYPLPRIKDLLLAIKGSKYFIALDQRAGYWQVGMRAEDIAKTAFRSHRGLHEFVVMPFGLVNAPATFQRLMDQLFGDLAWSGVLVYLDDVLIHHSDEREALRLLEIVLQRLSRAGLRLRLKKCEFGKTYIKYLGHRIGDGIVEPLREKVRALGEIPAPKNVSQVRQLLGLVGYYRDFVPNFAILAEPMFALLRKDVPFAWSEKCQAGWKRIKEILMTATLHNPLDSDDFVLETDASDYAVGAILSVRRGDQNLPVEFASHVLSEVQRRWPTREKEAYAIVWALSKFDYYLRGRRAMVFTDHKSLEWLYQTKKGKISRWAALISEYTLDIVHRPGKEMTHVDALSRLVDNEFIEDRMTCRAAFVPLSVEEIQEEQRKRPHPYGKWRPTTSGPLQMFNGAVYLPETLRSRAIYMVHGSAYGGHPGLLKTYKKIKQIFRWPRMVQEIRDYIKGCLTCQRLKSGRERIQGHFKTIPRSSPLKTVHVDVWGPVTGKSKFWVLTMIDKATRWVEVERIDCLDAATFVRVFISVWVARFGVPDVIVTDNAQAFRSEFAKQAAHMLGVSLRYTTVYHPEGNSPIETFHRWLRKATLYFENKSLDLADDEVLQIVVMGYRTSVHESLGDTPAYLLYGLDLTWPEDREIQELCLAVHRERAKLFKELRERIIREAEDLNWLANQRKNLSRKDLTFKVGDLVLVRREHTGKGHYNWSLPKRVLSVLPTGKTAVVQDLSGRKVTRVHLQNAKILEPPRCVEQVEDWSSHYSVEQFEIVGPTLVAILEDHPLPTAPKPSAPQDHVQSSTLDPVKVENYLLDEEPVVPMNLLDTLILKEEEESFAGSSVEVLREEGVYGLEEETDNPSSPSGVVHPDELTHDDGSSMSSSDESYTYGRFTEHYSYFTEDPTLQEHENMEHMNKRARLEDL